MLDIEKPRRINSLFIFQSNR